MPDNMEKLIDEQKNATRAIEQQTSVVTDLLSAIESKIADSSNKVQSGLQTTRDLIVHHRDSQSGRFVSGGGALNLDPLTRVMAGGFTKINTNLESILNAIKVSNATLKEQTDKHTSLLKTLLTSKAGLAVAGAGAVIGARGIAGAGAVGGGLLASGIGTALGGSTGRVGGAVFGASLGAAIGPFLQTGSKLLAKSIDPLVEIMKFAGNAIVGMPYVLQAGLAAFVGGAISLLFKNTGGQKVTVTNWEHSGLNTVGKEQGALSRYFGQVGSLLKGLNNPFEAIRNLFAKTQLEVKIVNFKELEGHIKQPEGFGGFLGLLGKLIGMGQGRSIAHKVTSTTSPEKSDADLSHLFPAQGAAQSGAVPILTEILAVIKQILAHLIGPAKTQLNFPPMPSTSEWAGVGAFEAAGHGKEETMKSSRKKTMLKGPWEDKKGNLHDPDTGRILGKSSGHDGIETFKQDLENVQKASRPGTTAREGMDADELELIGASPEEIDAARQKEATTVTTPKPKRKSRKQIWKKQKGKTAAGEDDEGDYGAEEGRKGEINAVAILTGIGAAFSSLATTLAPLISGLAALAPIALSLGAVIVPVALGFYILSGVVKGLYVVLDGLFGVVKSALGAVGNFAKSLLEAPAMVFKGLFDAFGKLASGDVFGALASGATSVVSAFDNVAKGTLGLIPIIGGFLQNVVGMVTGSINGLIDIFSGFAKNMLPFVAAISPSTLEMFNLQVRNLQATIGVAFTGFIGIMSDTMQKIGGILLPVMQELRPIFTELGATLQAFLLPAFKILAALLSSFTDLFKNLMTTFSSVMVNVIRSMVLLAAIISNALGGQGFIDKLIASLKKPEGPGAIAAGSAALTSFEQIGKDMAVAAAQASVAASGGGVPPQEKLLADIVKMLEGIKGEGIDKAIKAFHNEMEVLWGKILAQWGVFTAWFVGEAQPILLGILRTVWNQMIVWLSQFPMFRSASNALQNVQAVPQAVVNMGQAVMHLASGNVFSAWQAYVGQAGPGQIHPGVLAPSQQPGAVGFQ